jgi:hypothetical protein
MRKDFSQTRAAIVLEAVSPFFKFECTNSQGTANFLKALCKAAFRWAGEGSELDDAHKTHIIFCFTNSAYFMLPNFNSDLEDQVFNDCMFNDRDEVLGKLFSGLGLGDVSNTDSPFKKFLKDKADKVFDAPTEAPALKIFYNNGLINLPDIQIPDIREGLRNDFQNHFQLLKQKPRIISKNEVREFLIYFTVDLLQNYQENAEVIPSGVVEQVYEQIEDVATDVFGFAYEQISPEAEIFTNQNREYLLTVKDKYLNYLHN